MGLFDPPDIKKLSEKDDIQGLVRALKHKQPNIRAAAAEALGTKGEVLVTMIDAHRHVTQDPYDGPSDDLIGRMRSNIADPRFEAINQADLAKLRSQSMEPLIAALQDTSAEVRRQATCAIEKMGYARINGAFRDILKDPRPAPAPQPDNPVAAAPAPQPSPPTSTDQVQPTSIPIPVTPVTLAPQPAPAAQPAPRNLHLPPKPCDICGNPVNCAAAYLLHTDTVLASDAYLDYVIRGWVQQKMLPASLIAGGITQEHRELARNDIIRQAGGTPWRVCSNCLSMFSLNETEKAEAQRRAERSWSGEKVEGVKAAQPETTKPVAASPVATPANNQTDLLAQPPAQKSTIIPMSKYGEYLTGLARSLNTTNVDALYAIHKAYCVKCGVEFSRETLTQLHLFGPGSEFGGNLTVMGATQQGNDLRSGRCPYCGHNAMKIVRSDVPDQMDPVPAAPVPIVPTPSTQTQNTSDPQVFLARVEREFGLRRVENTWQYNGRGSQRLAAKFDSPHTCIDTLQQLRPEWKFNQFCIVIGRPVFFVLGLEPPFSVLTTLKSDDLQGVIDEIAVSTLGVRKISIYEDAYLVELKDSPDSGSTPQSSAPEPAGPYLKECARCHQRIDLLYHACPACGGDTFIGPTSPAGSQAFLDAMQKQGDAMLHVDRGAQYFSQGKTSDAENELRSAIQINPYNSTAYGNLGCVYLYSGRPGQAIPYFQKALELNPRLEGIPEALAEAKQKLGR